MTRLFVSYSSKNRDQVNQLVRLLQDAGYEVWYDQQIRTGQWWNVILENVRACDIFLYAVTPEYLASYPCDLEYRYAQALNRPMCPLRLSEIDFGLVPAHIALAQVIDVSGIDKNSRSLPVLLIRALRDLEQQHIPLPNPLPPEPDAPIMKLNEVIERISQLDMPLSPDDQKSLLDDIRVLLYRPESRTNARYALELYRKRAERDLRMLAHISFEIDALLELSAGGNTHPASPIHEQAIKEVQPTFVPTASTSKNTKTRSLFLPVIGLILIAVVLLGIGGVMLSNNRTNVGIAILSTATSTAALNTTTTATFTPVFTNTSPSTLTITPSVTNTSQLTNDCPEKRGVTAWIG